MTTNKHNPELENMEKILKIEKISRIFRLLFSMIFFTGIAFTRTYWLLLLLPVLFLFELKGFSLQKSFIKSKDEITKEESTPREIYFLHKKIQSGITINSIFVSLLFLLYLLRCRIIFAGVFGDTSKDNFVFLFDLGLKLFVGFPTALIRIIYIIISNSTYDRLQKYFDYFQQDSE